jgi:hypothetical protein
MLLVISLNFPRYACGKEDGELWKTLSKLCSYMLDSGLTFVDKSEAIRTHSFLKDIHITFF